MRYEGMDLNVYDVVVPLSGAGRTVGGGFARGDRLHEVFLKFPGNGFADAGKEQGKTEQVGQDSRSQQYDSTD